MKILNKQTKREFQLNKTKKQSHINILKQTRLNKLRSLDILNKHRAFSGWPGTFFEFKDMDIKVHGMRIIEADNNDIPGSIIDVTKDGIHLRVVDSVIVITHIQLPGKKIINSADIHNSYKDFFV